MAQTLYPRVKLKYKGADGPKELRVDAIGEQQFEELLGTLPKDIRENRGAFRLAELLTYGASLQDVPTGEQEESEESENGSGSDLNSSQSS